MPAPKRAAAAIALKSLLQKSERPTCRKGIQPLLLRCFCQAFVVANKFPIFRLVSGQIFRRPAQIIFDCCDDAHCQVRSADLAEYKRLVFTMSTHFGNVAVDDGKLVFCITAASNLQWDGTVQRRAYHLQGDVLEWRAPPRPDGDVPILVWRR